MLLILFCDESDFISGQVIYLGGVIKFMNFKNFSSEKIKDKIAIIENHKKFSYKVSILKYLNIKSS